MVSHHVTSSLHADVLTALTFEPAGNVREDKNVFFFVVYMLNAVIVGCAVPSCAMETLSPLLLCVQGG